MNGSIAKRPALVAHIVFRLDYGGLENGVVNIVNGMSGVAFRHAVIALSEATDFALRLNDGVIVESIGKRPGKDLGAYIRLYRLLRRLRPDIVHTRNIGTLDCAIIAFLARIPIRIHGEHGWDVLDPDGRNLKHRLLRLLVSNFVHRFVTVSSDLKRWLIDVVGINEAKVQHICNGVDARRFRPKKNGERSSLPIEFTDRDIVVIGSVTRFAPIKDPLNLVRAFVALRRNEPNVGSSARLVMIGDGELHEEAVDMLREAGLLAESWLPGSRDDIPELLRSMDLFVLGSRREGISNTILEAMASGLPVVATETGGNAELVATGINGCLVPPEDSVALASTIARYLDNANCRIGQGLASRTRVESSFSIGAMINDYHKLYERTLRLQRI